MRYILLLFLLLPFAASAAPLPMQDFAMLPIAHEGRIKPLSVFAREQLRDISGESEWQKQPAIDWLAKMVFYPESMHKERLILLESQPVREMLALPSHAAHQHDLMELQVAMRKHTDTILPAVLAAQYDQPLTPLQKELVQLYTRIQKFQQLQDSLNFLLPFPKKLRAQMEERGMTNPLFAIIPSTWPGDEDWHSPWELRFNGKGSPQSGEYLRRWDNMAQAYRTDDATKWQKAVEQATLTIQEMGAGKYHPLRLMLEEWYYRLSFLTLAAVGYGLFIFFVVIARRPRADATTQPTLLQRLAMTVYSLALAAHGLALLVRMLILERPPVSNLYESVLFVSFLIACAGLIMQQNRLRAGIAAISALLLILSQSLLSGQEQLPVVMAVLNTNFWLGTHVICITAGYAAAVLTSLMAHYRLYHLSYGENAPHPRGEVLPLIALLLTAVGTLLGGIWADQSWGRFWGWDPKENGALLIVLWLIWLLHGKLTGQFSERIYLAGLAYLNVIVSLAWFGVNLLSVGLHSYGFTSGTAHGLLAFIILETSFVGWLMWRSKRYA